MPITTHLSVKSALSIITFLMVSYTGYTQPDSSNFSVKYGNKGWEFKYGENNMMQVQWRLQLRGVLTSSDTILLKEEDNLNGSFNIQRARIKVGGYAYKPWLKYYIEFDFPSTNLLNWQFTVAKLKGIQLKVGQWKVDYNSERYVSSGKQQFADRSIANRYFTVDRQIGIELLGTLFDNSPFSSSYNIAIFNGDGRMSENQSDKPMLFGRYQWNFFGHAPKMAFSDIGRHAKPVGFLSASYIRNQSAYTRFSSSGGGEIPGFPMGTKAQYLVDQFGFELFAKFKGFSFMSEYHIKKIDDTVLKEVSELTGGYAMAGYFPNSALGFFPKNLEVIARVGLVQNSKFAPIQNTEYSFGANWFFKGHLNKLTLDVSFIDNEYFDAQQDNVRGRIQWDVSF